MKKTFFTILLALLFCGAIVSAQKTGYSEKHGNTFNLGIGIGGYGGYYNYVGHSVPVVDINYEFDVARNFTLAPFISFSSYRNGYYWNDNTYYFHESIIPIGVKGSYYFDQIFQAGPKWDFYLAGSLGFAIIRTSWDNGYNGDRGYYQAGSPFFFDFHAGAEYHFNHHVGGFLDLSTGVSTIGLSFK
ncbi:MAG: hypothetical protein HXX13_04220 [Bacteroidetes bacterium]|nr:hypothetical protein [Bacteroidota bacterium]